MTQTKYYEKLGLKTHYRHSLSCTSPYIELLKTSPLTLQKFAKLKESLSVQIRQNTSCTSPYKNYSKHLLTRQKEFAKMKESLTIQIRQSITHIQSALKHS